jgi:Xaa-Pro aminopeptidase
MDRLKRLHKLLSQQNLDGMVVAKQENVQYLTGLFSLHSKTREAIFFVGKGKAVLYHSPLIAPPLESKIRSVAASPENSYERVVKSVFGEGKKNRVGIEADNLTVAEMKRLEQVLGAGRLAVTSNLVEKLRLIKTPTEIELMAAAGRITAETMAKAIRKIQDGSWQDLNERLLARKIEFELFLKGAHDLAFPAIVAYGENSALPHHVPGERRLRKDEVVLLDFGAKVGGYCADMTRTFVAGRQPVKFIKVEQAVTRAYEKSLIVLEQSVVKAAEVDLAARGEIEAAGWGNNFFTSTGHGLGLEIHEPPSIFRTNQEVLKAMTTFTVEPGVYLPGEFGYRYENTVLKTLGGYRILTG